jgi:hypothetical protein
MQLRQIPKPSAKLFTVFILVSILCISTGYAIGTHKTNVVNLQTGMAFENYVTVDLWKKTYEPQLLMNGWDLIEVNEQGYHYQKITHNLITDDGQEFIQDQISGTPDAALIAKYIGVTNNSGAPAHTDTALTGEENAQHGLQRAAGTYAGGTAANGDVTWTLTHTFTANATVGEIQKAGLFTAAAASTMVAETTFGAVNMESDDTLALTWTFGSNNNP